MPVTLEVVKKRYKESYNEEMPYICKCPEFFSQPHLVMMLDNNDIICFYCKKVLNRDNNS